MSVTRPGEPTPTPRPGTGPQTPPDEQAGREERDTKPQEDSSLHPEEMSREKVESEMPADPDPDDPVSP